MDKSNPVEFLQNRWLRGRGTKVLYLAVLVTIAGTLLTGQSIQNTKAESKAAVQQAVQLASEVQKLCVVPEFRMGHTVACTKAEGILADPNKGLSSAGDLLDAAPVSK